MKEMEKANTTLTLQKARLLDVGKGEREMRGAVTHEIPIYFSFVLFFHFTPKIFMVESRLVSRWRLGYKPEVLWFHFHFIFIPHMTPLRVDTGTRNNSPHICN